MTSYKGADLVIVPAYNRPAFLHATLTRLRTVETGNVHYWIVLDRDHTPAAREVAQAFRAQDGGRVQLRYTPRHPWRGNSYSVLGAYQHAAHTDAERVHLVEDDVFVASGYFDFHRQAHALHPDAFAVSACRNHGRQDDAPPQGDAVYVSNHYQSLGVSFRREVLLKSVAPHGRDAYYRDPRGYLRAHFPGSRIHAGHTEQDGLINRICERGHFKVIYAATPRAYHAGFHGYNRAGTPLSGTVEQVSARLLTMSAAELNAHARMRDHQTVPLDESQPPVTHTIAWP